MTKIDRKPMAELKGVRYVGTNDRALSVADLEGQGVTAEGDLRWDSSNDHLVPIEHLNAATVDFLATMPDEFELV